MAADNPKDKPPWSHEEWLSFFNEMEALRKNLERMHRERDLLSQKFAREVLALCKDFFPEGKIQEVPFGDELYNYMYYYLEVAAYLIEYHVNETGLWYFKEAPERVGIFLSSWDETGKAKFLQNVFNQDVWNYMQELVREDYAMGVFYASFQWHLARLFKENLGEFEPELYDLPERAFLELEVLANLCSSELFDRVMEQLEEKQ